ncbi:MAG: barstar family protein [Phycisphaerae bacterium]
MTQAGLTTKHTPWIHVLAAPMPDTRQSPSQIWPVAHEDARRVLVRYLRGSAVRDTHALFSEYSAAMQFPYYFGRNWDAFNDCLCDLSWLLYEWFDGRGEVVPAAIITIMLDADDVLPDDPAAFRTWVELLHDAGESWLHPESSNSNRPPVVFRTILQTGKDAAALLDRLRAAGQPFNLFDLANTR